MLIFEDYKT